MNRRSGFSLVETMIVSTVFVLVAMSIYGTLNNITSLHGTADSSVILQLEGQRALNKIVDELRAAGFYRPQPDLTVADYDPALWTVKPEDDTHPNWDVPYLFAAEGAPEGIFKLLAHAPAKHKAVAGDEELDATQEMCFVPLVPMLNGPPAAKPQATVEWSNSMLGAQAAVVVAPSFKVVSYELQTGNDGINRLMRVERPIDLVAGTVGAVSQQAELAKDVEAVRFDTAQTDASLSLYTVRCTIWLRKTATSGTVVGAKVSSRVKLRNSAK
ncbi:MAG TPA: prepilin-type N-terminal cleavage/methylation domain-containing protein [Planctomycetota bacterium]|nr:prepilin-type N-terminal cleavage/methylation domain-containing protein [Planctomycetota bacterium]